MKDLWTSIEADQWRTVPCVAGRTATEADVVAGRAVFYVPTGSIAVRIELPCCAIQTLDDGSKQHVVVIQAEQMPEGIAFGVRPLSGGNGVCMESELELLPNGLAEQSQG